MNNNPKGAKNPKKPLIFYYAVMLLVLMMLNWLLFPSLLQRQVTEVGYDEFISMVDKGQVETIAYDKQDQEITFEAKNDKGKDALYKTGIFPDDELVGRLLGANVKFAAEIPTQTSPLLSMLISYVVPIVLIIAVGQWLQKKMMKNMGGNMMSFGKSNAKIYAETETGKTFADVAGQDEAKEALTEIVDFLHNPNKYASIGAKLPKGALLVGSPGTGKTLLAKAVAGEANVPFFSISGSDFVEMFVGVGASRVRDLFKEAAKMAPCIIFIDEIDTIGKKRDSGGIGGNDEREQTLNQLLAELDGFDPTKGVIVLGATNRPEVLDKALLRPGRFDRRITVDRPNLAGRLATLQVHTRNIRLSEDVNLEKIAAATAGCVGADLANLVNEAALRAVRMGRQAVNQNDLLASFEMVIAGAEKKGTVLTEKEKKLIAYHEVGHALVAARQKNTQPVSKITIVPHTQGALGYTMQTPEEEKFLEDREELLADLRTLLGGRAAEWAVFHTMTTGASNDIERATDLARKMVTMYGMSDRFGMMALASKRSQYLDGGYGMDCAQDTAAALDEAIERLAGDETMLRIHDGSAVINVPLSQVRSITADGHYLNLSTANGPLRWRQSFGRLADMVAPYPQLFACNRGIMVNLAHVDDLTDDGCFLMDHGSKLPVRRSSRAEARSRYFDYLFTHVRR